MQHVEESKLKGTSCGENICAEMKNEKKNGVVCVKCEQRAGQGSGHGRAPCISCMLARLPTGYADSYPK